MRAYCSKCSAEREMLDAKPITTQNGEEATQGICPTCGTEIVSILREAMAPPVHFLLTEDALDSISGRPLSHSDIAAIAFHVAEADFSDEGHGEMAAHRVTEYQRLFERCGGKTCDKPGAEERAKQRLEAARACYLARPRNENWRRELGYAIHHIEDGNWFPHIFPLKEGLTGAHTWAELASMRHYGRKWSGVVRDAPETVIPPGTDIQQLLVDLAHDTFHNCKCSCTTPNGKLFKDGQELDTPSDLSGWEWVMSDEDLARSVAGTASLVKGAALWVISPAD